MSYALRATHVVVGEAMPAATHDWIAVEPGVVQASDASGKESGK